MATNYLSYLPQFLWNKLQRIFDQHNHLRTGSSGKQASTKTQRERRQIILLAFSQLWMLGYKIQQPASLGGKHIERLAKYWLHNGLAARTLHARMSALRVFARWINKDGLVKSNDLYFPPEAIERSGIATSNKAWRAHGVDPIAVLEKAREIDIRLALYFELMYCFGLRVKEAIEFRPLHAVIENGAAIEVREGTKGGRLRHVPLDTEEQMRIFRWACAIAKKSPSGRIRWPDMTWRQAQNHFYHLLRYRLKISRKEVGVTAHGLRHGYAQTKYRQLTGGLPTPIEGGAIGLIDRNTHQTASISVSRALGHSRTAVTAMYYGSYGHALRGTNAPGNGKQDDDPEPEPVI
ncbi:MAG: integrase domain-containing protein [Rhodocyclaceae bacterium]|nr:integrase domain-containing protein [Rhodocyclaceae bacterium]